MNYREEIEKLRTTMHNSALNTKNNPIVQKIDQLYESDIEYLVQQYAIFVKNAIHYLLGARINLYSWEKLAAEIDHNLEEEKGLKTKGIPHIIMMTEGFRELDIKTNYKVEKSLYTEMFLKRMDCIFSEKRNPALLAGALLAFEGTSIFEFEVLDLLLKRYEELTGKSSDLANKYVNGHKEFEITHEQGLIASTQDYITEENQEMFIHGYKLVVEYMIEWWKGLSLECAP